MMNDTRKPPSKLQAKHQRKALVASPNVGSVVRRRQGSGRGEGVERAESGEQDGLSCLEAASHFAQTQHIYSGVPTIHLNRWLAPTRLASMAGWSAGGRTGCVHVGSCLGLGFGAGVGRGLQAGLDGQGSS